MTKSGFENKGLPPPGAATRITEADRSRMYEVIRNELEERLNGPSSYYPDGGRKDRQVLLEDLSGLIRDVTDLHRFVDDPSNLIDEIATHLKEFQEGFQKANKTIERNELNDPIQIPPEFTPETYDRGRDIGVDLDPERPSNPLPDPPDFIERIAYPGILDLAGRGISAGDALYRPWNAATTMAGDSTATRSSTGSANPSPPSNQSVDQSTQLFLSSPVPFGWVLPRQRPQSPWNSW